MNNQEMSATARAAEGLATTLVFEPQNLPLMGLEGAHTLQEGWGYFQRNAQNIFTTHLEAACVLFVLINVCCHPTTHYDSHLLHGLCRGAVYAQEAREQKLAYYGGDD